MMPPPKQAKQMFACIFGGTIGQFESALHCAVMCCAVLYCLEMCCGGLFCSFLNYTVLCSTVLSSSVQYVIMMPTPGEDGVGMYVEVASRVAFSADVLLSILPSSLAGVSA